jgi:hypothetical protein
VRASSIGTGEGRRDDGLTSSQQFHERRARLLEVNDIAQHKRNWLAQAQLNRCQQSRWRRIPKEHFMNKKTSILVAFGVGADGKPHAAQFDGSQEALVRKAAGLLNFRIGRAVTDKAHELAKHLPEGKIHAAGDALAPVVKPELYEKLKGCLNVEAGGANSALSGNALTALWAEIKVGSVVLCQDETNEPAWWECVVVSISKDNETLTLRWQNYPAFASFPRKRQAVGFAAPLSRS